MNDNQLKARALIMWANYIETGTVTISAADAIKAGKFSILKVLNSAQKHMVQRLHDLANQELKNA